MYVMYSTIKSGFLVCAPLRANDVCSSVVREDNKRKIKVAADHALHVDRSSSCHAGRNVPEHV